MRVAVTGGTGFLGSEIVRQHLAVGDEVRVLSRRLGPFCADLTDPQANLSSFVSNVDILYHCAGELGDTGRMHALHVEGTRRLLAAASGRIGHWVQISSVGAYGPREEGVVTEFTATAPLGPYEITKTLSDEAVLAAAERAEFFCSILRPSNVVGSGMKTRSVFGLISAIARGYFFYVGASGAQTNYVHVSNVAEAALLCGHRTPSDPRIYIVSDTCSFEDFASQVADCLGRPRPRMRVPLPIAQLVAGSFGRLPGFPLTPSRVHALNSRATYSTDKIEAELDYRPKLSIQQTIADLVMAWRQHDKA